MLFRSPSVDEGKLEMDGAVKVIEEVAPVLENGILVLILRQLIIDIIKTDGLGIIFILHPAYPVLCHFPVRDGLLGGDTLLLPLLFLPVPVPASFAVMPVPAFIPGIRRDVTFVSAFSSHFYLHSEAFYAEDASRISYSALRSTEFVTLRHKFLVE